MKKTNRREQRAELEATHVVKRNAPLPGASLAEIAEYYPAVRAIVTECAKAMLERDRLSMTLTEHYWGDPLSPDEAK